MNPIYLRNHIQLSRVMYDEEFAAPCWSSDVCVWSFQDDENNKKQSESQ